MELHKFYDRANMENMIDFMRSVHRRFDRVAVFMDNMSCHCKEWLERPPRELDNDTVLVFSAVHAGARPDRAVLAGDSGACSQHVLSECRGIRVDSGQGHQKRDHAGDQDMRLSHPRPRRHQLDNPIS